MKYDSLKRQAVESLKVNKFDGGLNLEKAPSLIENNELTECKNLWYKEGRLQTRPGLLAKDLEKLTWWGGCDSVQYTITDAVYYYLDDYHKIAFGKILADDYVWSVYFQLIAANGEIVSIGNLDFLRTASDVFYEPINVLVYTGKPQKGAGIFAFITKANRYTPFDKLYEVYEVSKNYKTWTMLNDFYVPTVYINGRGNNYQLANAENKISVEAPKTIESPNMLNGRFNAYYTSDGYSNLFKLPYSYLANETVVCRVYYTLDSYVEWTVKADTIRDTKKLLGYSVDLEVDRDTGTFYFLNDDKSYSLPVMSMCPKNNIRITATKEIENGLGKVVHSTCLAINDSRIILSGGDSGNEVYIANYDFPLYFPQDAVSNVGSPDSEVTALINHGEKIIAFKGDEIHTLTLVEKEKINQISLLSDNDKIFESCGHILASEITRGIGCIQKTTIAKCGEEILFLATDKKIYSLNPSSKKVQNISEKIQKIMPDYYRNVFAVSDGLHYILFVENKAIVAEYDKKSGFRFYNWEWPKKFKILSGYHKNQNFIFVATDESVNLFYTCKLVGDTDNYLYYDDNEKKQSEDFDINASITTKHFDFSSFRQSKNIESIYLMIGSKGKTKISVNGKEIANINLRISKEGYDNGEYKIVKFTPHLYDTDLVYLTFETENSMSIGELEILYRKIG